MPLTFTLSIRCVYTVIAAVITYCLMLQVSLLQFDLMKNVTTFFQPWNQYTSKSTSVLTEVLEPRSDNYPSITVCTGPKYYKAFL